MQAIPMERGEPLERLVTPGVPLELDLSVLGRRHSSPQKVHTSVTVWFGHNDDLHEFYIHVARMDVPEAKHGLASTFYNQEWALPSSIPELDAYICKQLKETCDFIGRHPPILYVPEDMAAISYRLRTSLFDSDYEGTLYCRALDILQEFCKQHGLQS
jgi:hypothetical protein